MNALEKEKRRKFRLGVRKFQPVIDFVTAIEDEMRRREIRPSELADKLRKSRAWVSKVFRQKPNLTFFTAVELADALDLDVRVEVVPRAAMVHQAPLSCATVPVPHLRLLVGFQSLPNAAPPPIRNVA
jgi:hypothetical protein